MIDLKFSIVKRLGRTLLCAGCFGLTGCLIGKANPATTQPVTYVAAVEATPEFWWNQPGVTRVTGPGFQQLWDACKGQLYFRLFTVDREDYGEGLLSSEPLVSKQFFELWRFDVMSPHDIAESSLGSIRRTVRFEFSHDGKGWAVTPKVLVERYVLAEKRLTSITQYHTAITASGPKTDDSTEAAATDYWYPVRRDTDLEQEIAGSIRDWIGGGK